MADKKNGRARIEPEEDSFDLRLSPERRLCPKFDETSIAMYRVAPPQEMGMRVRDNCAEEHEQS